MGRGLISLAESIGVSTLILNVADRPSSETSQAAYRPIRIPCEVRAAASHPYYHENDTMLLCGHLVPHQGPHLICSEYPASRHVAYTPSGTAFAYIFFDRRARPSENPRS